MATPAVTIAPVGPWAHTEEYAVVEVPWPVKAHGRTVVRRVIVVAVRANRLNADADHNLGVGCWRQGQTREQCCCAN
jgi:hypothetical protein